MKTLVPATSQDFLRELLSKAPKDIVKFSNKMIYGEQTKYVRVKIPDKFKRIEITMLTDVQFGHEACQLDKVIKQIEWIKSNPRRFVLFGGDMIDAATSLSVASPYENTMNPFQQVVEFVRLLMPIRHRILGYVGGNHEHRTKKLGDFSLGSFIASFLQIPYSHGKQIIDINYGEHKTFMVDLWHGSGSARTKGAKAQMLQRFMQQGDSQLYLCGHLHDVVLLFDWRQKRHNGGIKLEKIAGVMSSSFLNYWNTYAEIAGLPPSDTMMARVILEANGHWEVTLR
ncbi:hypothetical protein LCGC14_1736540 [marine sediment metagenome]|uniref:Calcineurin-like phosphoesterase domain-containing protein n=1 Tax=marine sediment metagenome TaxID=412755 RepID=A0A0F9JNC0_9ZZZZ